MAKQTPIQRLRERLGLSQEKVARVAGVTHQQISNVERGGSGLSARAILKIWRRWGEPLQAIGVNLEKLIEGSTLPPSKS